MTDFFEAVDDLAKPAKAPKTQTSKPSTGATLTLHLLSPLVHGAFGQSAGYATLIRRYTVTGIPGMPRVPAVSGNALRGVLRRQIFRDLFERAGLGPGKLPGTQWDRLYAACANGGHLEGSEQTYKPDAVLTLREALPPLSVFGSALYSWMLAGRAQIGILWPRCKETEAAGLVEDLAPMEGVESYSAEDLVEEVSLVRHIESEQQDSEVTGVTPMPTTMETLVTGTELTSRIGFLRSATAVERGCIYDACKSLGGLGGKGSTGHGRVRAAIEGDDVVSDIQAWREWRETADLRTAFLDLAEKLDAKKGKKSKAKKKATKKVDEKPKEA